MAMYGILLAAYLVVLTFQSLIPPIELLHGARVILTPVFVCYVALAFDYPFVLGFALFAGFLWDALTVQFISKESGLGVEILMGWSIVVYGILGSLAHGLRPVFFNGRWWVLILLSGFMASFVSLTEFLTISVLRFEDSKEFIFPAWLWLRILGEGAICALVSIPFYFGCRFVGAFVNFDFRPEELRERI